MPTPALITSSHQGSTCITTRGARPHPRQQWTIGQWTRRNANASICNNWRERHYDFLPTIGGASNWCGWAYSHPVPWRGSIYTTPAQA